MSRGSGSKKRKPGTPERRKRRKLTTTEKGLVLEQRVMRIMRNFGFANVRRSVLIRDTRGHRSEIDVMGRYFLVNFLVECKNYSKPLPLEMVAKFKEVLAQNRIGIWRGLLVTTATTTPRVRHAGVRVWDGETLTRMEALSKHVRTLRVVGRGAVALALAYAAVVSQARALSAAECEPDSPAAGPLGPWLHPVACAHVSSPWAGLAVGSPSAFPAGASVATVLQAHHDAWQPRVEAWTAMAEATGERATRLGRRAFDTAVDWAAETTILDDARAAVLAAWRWLTGDDGGKGGGRR